MKKCLVFVSVIFFVISFIGCNNPSSPAPVIKPEFQYLTKDCFVITSIGDTVRGIELFLRTTNIGVCVNEIRVYSPLNIYVVYYGGAFFDKFITIPCQYSGKAYVKTTGIWKIVVVGYTSNNDIFDKTLEIDINRNKIVK